MSRRGENIYKRKDGRYEGRYVIGRTGNGRTKFGYVYGRQYSAVRDELLRRKTEQLAGRKRSSEKGPAFSSFLYDWLSEIRGTIKQSSYQTYLSFAEKHVIPSLGPLGVAQITASAVMDFADSLLKAGLSASTVKSVCRLVSACLCYAQEEGYIQKNPCRRLRLSADEPVGQRVLTGVEQAKVSKAAMDASELPVLLAAYTGMRLGEICALRWTDINWEKGTVSVSRTAQRIRRSGGGTMILVDTPKSVKSRRILPVPAFLMELLEKHRGEGAAGYLFGSELNPAEPRTVQRRFQSLLKKTGIQNVHFHTLRHSFATRLIELGVDIKTVSSLLGHSSAKTTLDFYVHSMMDAQRSAIEKLAAI